MQLAPPGPNIYLLLGRLQVTGYRLNELIRVFHRSVMFSIVREAPFSYATSRTKVLGLRTAYVRPARLHPFVMTCGPERGGGFGWFAFGSSYAYACACMGAYARVLVRVRARVRELVTRTCVRELASLIFLGVIAQDLESFANENDVLDSGVSLLGVAT